MSLLTFIVIAVVAYGVFGKHGYGRALALGGATAAGAFLVVGSVSVPTFYAVGLGGVMLLLLQALTRPRGVVPLAFRDVPGVPVLAAFLAWSTLITLLAPLAFDGATVVSPTVGYLKAGVITSSNIAQIIYLVIGIAVVILLARSDSAGPGIIGLSLSVAMGLSLWRYLHLYAGVPFPEGLFDNSPTFAYIELAPGGVPRFRGIFSEPSALAGSALVAMAFGISRAIRVRGAQRVWAIVLGAVALFLGLVSTSTTFVVAGAAMAIIAAIVFVAGLASQSIRFSAGAVVVGSALAIVAIWALPFVANFVGAQLDLKIGTASYSERTNSDSASYEVFLNSWGLGVGLGAGRASSFVPTILSTTGLIGGLLFAGAVFGIVYRSMPLREYRPVLWSLVTLLVVKFIAGPDLSDPTGLLWMSLGVLAHGIVNRSPAPHATLPLRAGDRPIAQQRGDSS